MPIYLSSTTVQRTMWCPICIKLIGSRDESVRIENISCKYYANTLHSDAWNFVLASLPFSLFVRFSLFREFLARKCWRAYKTRCNSIKTPAFGINRQRGDSDYREISRAMRRKIKFFNKTKLRTDRPNFVVLFLAVTPPVDTGRLCNAARKRKLEEVLAKSSEKRVRDPVAQINARLIFFFSLKVFLDSKKRSMSMR